MRIEIDQTVGRVLSSTIITDSIHFDLIRRTAKLLKPCFGDFIRTIRNKTAFDALPESMIKKCLVVWFSKSNEPIFIENGKVQCNRTDPESLICQYFINLELKKLYHFLEDQLNKDDWYCCIPYLLDIVKVFHDRRESFYNLLGNWNRVELKFVNLVHKFLFKGYENLVQYQRNTNIPQLELSLVRYPELLKSTAIGRLKDRLSFVMTRPQKPFDHIDESVLTELLMTIQTEDICAFEADIKYSGCLFQGCFIFTTTSFGSTRGITEMRSDAKISWNMKDRHVHIAVPTIFLLEASKGKIDGMLPFGPAAYELAKMLLFAVMITKWKRNRPKYIQPGSETHKQLIDAARQKIIETEARLVVPAFYYW
jgi:hypothetical protein